MRTLIAAGAAGLLILIGTASPAGEIFVDNFTGDDRNDGGSAEQAGTLSGPVRTIRRGLQLVGAGDSLVLANRGVPYYESMELIGSRFSGTPQIPFVVVGNGAVLDGSRLVPKEAWVRIEGDLWKFTPWRKGHFQLILDEKVVPEHPLARTAEPKEIPPGKWSAWRGSIYYHSENSLRPGELPFAFAADQVGLSMYAVRFVRVRDLTIRYFRLDGVNAHDLCGNVLIENVTCAGNGRSGLSIGGTSEAAVRQCDLRGNREYSFRVEEFGSANLQETRVDESPAPAEPPPANENASDATEGPPSRLVLRDR